MDWFLYHKDLDHESVNARLSNKTDEHSRSFIIRI